MSTRPTHTNATVLERRVLSPHLIRLRLEPEHFTSTGICDEWVALTVPGQYQNRYYTVRAWDGEVVTVDVVVHEHGLVTEWAQTECVGETVVLSEAKGSFALPEDAQWLLLVGDLTALPAIARICEETSDVATQVHVEAPAGTQAAYPDPPEATWHDAGPDSRLADLVAGIEFPQGPGYFWMAGESAQMRDIRRHARRVAGLDPKRTDVMGYWSNARGRQARKVDPGPIYAAGRVAGKSDDQIWADYDAARDLA